LSRAASAAAQAAGVASALGAEFTEAAGEGAAVVEQSVAERWSSLGADASAVAGEFSDAVALGAAEAAEAAAGGVSIAASSLRPPSKRTPASAAPRLAAPNQPVALLAPLASNTDVEGARAGTCGASSSSAAEEGEEEEGGEEEEEEEEDEDEDEVDRRRWLGAQEDGDTLACATHVPVGHRYRVRIDKAPSGSFGLTVKLYRSWGVVVHALPRVVAATAAAADDHAASAAAGALLSGAGAAPTSVALEHWSPAKRAGVAPGDVLVAIGDHRTFDADGALLVGTKGRLGALLRAAPATGAVLTFDRPAQQQLLAASASEPPRDRLERALERAASGPASGPFPLVRRLAVRWRPALWAAGGFGGGVARRPRAAQPRALAALLQAHGAVSAADAFVLSAQLACLERRAREWATRGGLALPAAETAHAAAGSSASSSSAVAAGFSASPPVAGLGAGDSPTFASLPLAADRLAQPDAWQLRCGARRRALASQCGRLAWRRGGPAALPLEGVRRALSVRVVSAVSAAPAAAHPFHTEYVVFVSDAESGSEWTVNRRFNEFRALEQRLADCWPQLRPM
jgi:hypothetical protein